MHFLNIISKICSFHIIISDYLVNYQNTGNKNIVGEQTQKALHFDSNPRNLISVFLFLLVSPYSKTIKEQYYSCVLVVLVRVDFFGV